MTNTDTHAHEVSSSPVEIEIRGQVAIIWLNRPNQRNSINLGLTTGLRDAIRQVEENPDLRVAILAGRGEAFCAGMDLKAFDAGDHHDIIFGEGRFAGFVDLPRRKPIIAAVHGFALAGGFELMLACDMVVAGESSQFGVPEACVGLFAAAGGCFRLAARMPLVKAKELMLTGTMITAKEALQYGLLNHLVLDDQVLDRALKLADGILACAPLSVEMGLELTKSAATSQETEIWEQNNALFAKVLNSNDAKEGARAFIEKRSPVWTGT